jgi:hypothetical protein
MREPRGEVVVNGESDVHSALVRASESMQLSTGCLDRDSAQGAVKPNMAATGLYVCYVGSCGNAVIVPVELNGASAIFSACQ